MDAPTPNTAAFLSYLSSSFGTDLQAGIKDANPSSLPPSAFFPVPGRDTPEDTPPSSVDAVESPEKNVREQLSAESDDDAHVDDKRRGSKSATHKRKAGQGHQVNDDEEDDEDDSASDFATGHNDKRQHHNDPASKSTRKPGRKSTGGDEVKTKEPTKAARRKEQNRAAQKAFRERREAKVRDLEEQVRSLEAKSYGTSVENENLRGILKRLQEENVALRQAAFTFSMPVGDNTGSKNGSQSQSNGAPAQQQQQQQQQQKTQRPPSKPPTPVEQRSPDTLRSVKDTRPSFNPAAHRSSDSPTSFVSPASAARSNSTSSSSGSPLNLFNSTENAFTTAALGGIRGTPFPPSLMGSNNQSVSSSTTTPESNGRTEMDALWANFLAQTPHREVSQQQANGAQNPYSLLNAQQQPMTFADNNAKFGNAQPTSNGWDKTAFRDRSEEQAQDSIEVKQETSLSPNNVWGEANTSVDEFLASLTGASVDKDLTKEDDFNAQLQELLGSQASPSAMFNLPNVNNPFSPTSYLNMSPSPLNSISNGQSPHSAFTNGSSISTTDTPESSLNDAASCDSPGEATALVCPLEPGDSEPIYVVDENGKIVKPSELWTRMGMPNETNVEHLIVDDLCAMMRAKATCKDGKKVVSAADAERMFIYKGSDQEADKRMRNLEQRVGLPGGMFKPRAS